MNCMAPLFHKVLLSRLVFLLLYGTRPPIGTIVPPTIESDTLQTNPLTLMLLNSNGEEIWTKMEDERLISTYVYLYEFDIVLDQQ
jgi:hypothetical protein